MCCFASPLFPTPLTHLPGPLLLLTSCSSLPLPSCHTFLVARLPKPFQLCMCWQIAHFPVSAGGFCFQGFAARAVTSFVVPCASAARRANDGSLLQSSELALSPSGSSAFANSLAPWRASSALQARTFCCLAPHLLSYEQIHGVAELPCLSSCHCSRATHSPPRPHSSTQKSL